MPGDLITTSNADSALGCWHRCRAVNSAYRPARAPRRVQRSLQNRVSRQCRQTTAQRAIRRAALAAPAPQRDPLQSPQSMRCRAADCQACELRTQALPDRPPARDVRRRSPSAAATICCSSGGQLRTDLAGETFDDLVLAPFGALGQSQAIAARDSLPSPTHSNGLWSWIFEQRVVAADLRRGRPEDCGRRCRPDAAST